MGTSASQSVMDSAARRGRPDCARRAPVPFTPVPLTGGPVLQRQPGCACGGGCPRCQQEKLDAPLQAKLKVSTPGDLYEQEADRIADQVTGMSETPGHVHEGGKALMLQKRGEGEAQGTTDSSVSEVISSGGEPLDATTREFMETRFGRTFGDVRVHTGGQADASARAVNALGYTLGRDIVFAAGEYAPHTAHGRRLLAHELAHVVQQGGGASPAAGQLSAAEPATLQRAIPTRGSSERRANAPRIAEMRRHIEAMRQRMAEARYAPIRAEAIQALDAAAAVITSYERGTSVSAGGTPMAGYAASPSTTVTSGASMTPLGAAAAIGIGVVSFIWGLGTGPTGPSFSNVEAAVQRLDEVLDRAIMSLPPTTPSIGTVPTPAPSPAPGAAPGTPTTTTTTTQTNTSGPRQLVADSNIFMDRQNPADVLPVTALLANSSTTLFVPAAAWNEAISGDRFGTQVVRLAGLPGGATVVPDVDGTLTGINPAALVASKTFNQNDMKIVQRAKERTLPLVTVNGAMATQISGFPARAAVWGMVRIVRPP